MSKQRPLGLRANQSDDSCARKKSPVSRFADQQCVEELQKALAVLNDQIVELENNGQQGQTVAALRLDAMALACQIDDLRCFLLKSR
jgi:hypothetical protein